MNRTYFYIGVGVAVLVLIGIVIYSNKAYREGFRLLGTMAPYQEVYYHCTSQCEKADKGTRPSLVHGNAACQQFCDYTVGKMATEEPIKVVTNPNGDPSPKIKKVKTAIDEAYEVCGDGESNEQCRSDYFTFSEIDEKCRIDCKYYETGNPIGSSAYEREMATVSPKQHIENMNVCMAGCKKFYAPNKSLGWNWK